MYIHLYMNRQVCIYICISCPHSHYTNIYLYSFYICICNRARENTAAYQYPSPLAVHLLKRAGPRSLGPATFRQLKQVCLLCFDMCLGIEINDATSLPSGQICIHIRAPWKMCCMWSLRHNPHEKPDPIDETLRKETVYVRMRGLKRQAQLKICRSYMICIYVFKLLVELRIYRYKVG